VGEQLDLFGYVPGYIFVRQVQRPSPADCAYTADPSALTLLRGTIDLMLTSRYRAVLLVGTWPQGDAGDGLDATGVTIEGAETVVEASDGHRLLSSNEPGPGFVDPPAGAEPGWGLIEVDLISGANGANLSQTLGLPQTRGDNYVTVVSSISVRGRTIAGRPVVADNFKFPVDVCYGCLLRFPQEANDTTEVKQPNCMSPGSAEYASPCFFGQDDPVDCRVCKQHLDPDTCEP